MSTSTRVCETFIREKRDPNFFVISKRGDLESDQFQDALWRQKKGESFLNCGCMAEVNIWPELRARIGPRKPLLCCRLRVKQHGPGCIFETIYLDQPELPLSTSLFAVPREHAAPTAEGSSATESGQGFVEWMPFGQFNAKAAARAATDSMLVSCPDGSPKIQPSNEQFFRAWLEALNAKAFEGSLSAFEAARHEGVELMFGVVFVQPTPRDDGPSLVTGHWWSGSGLKTMVFSASAKVLHDGMGRLRGRNSVLSPSYLCAAAVGPTGTVRHIWFIGIWTDGLHLVFTASETERGNTAKVRSEGGIIFVPLFSDDLDRLAPILPRMQCQMVWRYTPDGIVWRPDSAHPDVPDVVEVRGYEPGTYPEYDKDFEAKLPWYLDLGSRYRFVPVDGWRMTNEGCSFSRNEWLNPAIERGWFSPSAREVWNELRRRMGDTEPGSSNP